MTAVAIAANSEFSDVALAAKGDGQAFERLYRAHVARVNALARWLLGGYDTEDAVQEVFIRAWEKLGTFHGDSAFGTWLPGGGSRHCGDFFRTCPNTRFL